MLNKITIGTIGTQWGDITVAIEDQKTVISNFERKIGFHSMALRLIYERFELPNLHKSYFFQPISEAHSFGYKFCQYLANRYGREVNLFDLPLGNLVKRGARSKVKYYTGCLTTLSDKDLNEHFQHWKLHPPVVI